jgi:hypothetical protein
MIKDKLPMGQQVSFTAISERQCKHNSWRDKDVIRVDCKGEGIIAGVRQLQSGYTDGGAPDQAYGWICTKHVDVYLVAVSYGQIVRVQPEDITEVTP